MLRIIATALFALFVTPSYAQQAIPIDTCGTLSDNVTAGGPAHVLYMDKFGTSSGSVVMRRAELLDLRDRIDQRLMLRRNRLLRRGTARFEPRRQ